jgi:hypothetical protein
MGRFKKSFGISVRSSQFLAETFGMAKPYLPFASCGLDREATWVWTKGINTFAAEATRANFHLLGGPLS